MKKWNNKGFMLAETLVISTVVLTALVAVYVQFRNVQKSYYTSFQYNGVNDMYQVKNIRDFIKRDTLVFQTITNSLEEGTQYVDITSCPSNIFGDTEYCLSLFNLLHVKQVLVTKEDITNLKAAIKTMNPFNEGMKNYIQYLSPAKEDKYRIIVEFQEGTFATLKVER